MTMFVIPDERVPLEFPLSHLLYENFAYHDSVEENIKELNDLIKAIEAFRDNLLFISSNVIDQS